MIVKKVCEACGHVDLRTFSEAPCPECHGPAFGLFVRDGETERDLSAMMSQVRKVGLSQIAALHNKISYAISVLETLEDPKAIDAVKYLKGEGETQG